MPPSKSLPPHLYRARWLTTLINSLNTPILYRPLRDLHNILTLNRATLDIEISKLTRTAQKTDIWSFPPLHTFLKIYLATQDSISTRYSTIMTSLLPPNKPWETWPRPSQESTIKEICVLHTYATILINSFDDVFGSSFDDDDNSNELQFLHHPAPLRTTPSTLPRRRWSEGSLGHNNIRTLHNRIRVEKTCTEFTKTFKKAMTSSLLEVPKAYNEGYLFTEFWRYIRWSNERDRRYMEEEMGMAYKYPEEMWTLRVCGDEGGWGECASWEEDRELRGLFSG